MKIQMILIEQQVQETELLISLILQEAVYLIFLKRYLELQQAVKPELVQRKAKIFKLKLKYLHLIISHHGTLENGSAKVPMTLEAIALYYIDSLDAKLAEFHRNLCEDVNSDSHWTNYIPGLDRKLYKNRN